VVAISPGGQSNLSTYAAKVGKRLEIYWGIKNILKSF
jgi:hypothetical protein